MERIGTTIDQKDFLRLHRQKYSNYIFQTVNQLGSVYGFQFLNADPFKTATPVNDATEPTGRDAKPPVSISRCGHPPLMVQGQNGLVPYHKMRVLTTF
jgi:hypothetical protein